MERSTVLLNTPKRLSFGISFGFMLCFLVTLMCSEPTAFANDPVTPLTRIQNEFTKDPDDMCFANGPGNTGWVVVSDKYAGRVFLFNQDGKQLDGVEIPKPGNIDIREDYSFGGTTGPIIVVNQREPVPQLRALTIDQKPNGPRLRLLKSELPTGVNNYGGCLYRSRVDQQLYFFSTTKGGKVQQFHLHEKKPGLLTQTRVRAWDSPICEGAVADDELGVVYVGEEDVGIRKLGAEPGDSTNGKLILKVGEHKVTGDIEGLTLFPTGPGKGYLIASDQGRSRFIVLDRAAPHRYIGEVSIKGATDTDGIDVMSGAMGTKFPHGVFACHSAPGAVKCVLLTPWQNIARQFATPKTITP